MGFATLLLAMPFMGFSQSEPNRKILVKVVKDGKSTEMVLEGTQEEIEKALQETSVENEDVLAFMDQNVILDLEGEGRQGFSLDKKRPILGITFLTGKESVIVEKVIEESAAEEMGIKKGDQIISINGRQITNEEDLKSEISKNGLDKEIEITVLRDGKKQSFKGKLKSMNIQMREEVILRKVPREARTPQKEMFFFDAITPRDQKVFENILKGLDYSQLNADVSIKELNGDNFLITASNLENKKVSLEIFDANGKSIFSKKYEGTTEFAQTFELKDIVPGFYYAIVKQDDALVKEKFTVK